MNTNQQLIDMGFTKERFPVGTHLCLIYSDEEDRRRLIAQFLESGLKRSEKVGYFADAMNEKEVLKWLQERGVCLPKEEKRNQFSVHVAENVYCPHGKFDPEEMLETLRTYYRKALEEGYNGARVSGEMSWALKGIPGSERLMEYEALINQLSETHPVTPICQYNANLFDGATILNCLKVHPMMIVHGQIVRNPYYMKPEEFLKGVFYMLEGV